MTAAGKKGGRGRETDSESNTGSAKERSEWTMRHVLFAASGNKKSA